VKDPLSLEIRWDKRFAKVVKLVSEWEVRSKAVARYLSLLAAEYTKEQMLLLIPKSEEWAKYRQSLEAATIVGSPYAHAVLRSNEHFRRLKKTDVPKTVLYIKAKRKLRRVSQEIEILERHSPWTLSTLPFMPKRSEALVVSRKVSKQEVTRVEKARNSDRPKWKRALIGAGSPPKKAFPMKQVKSVPDTTFEALRLEFGLGGVKQKAHWRPSLHRLRSVGIKSIIRQHPELQEAFLSLRFNRWKKWPPKTRHKVRAGEARNYLPFQKKLGIR
jgi:hypothetical protein